MPTQISLVDPKKQARTRCSKSKRPNNGVARRAKELEKQLAGLRRDYRALEKEIAGRELAEDQFAALDALRDAFVRIFGELGRFGAGRLPLAMRLEVEELFRQLGWSSPW